MLTHEEAQLMLDSIDMSGHSWFCVIAPYSPFMVVSFVRVSAVVGMNADDYYQQGKHWWLRLHEKGGKHHELPIIKQNISTPI